MTIEDRLRARITINERCGYAVEHGMKPDDTLKTISENILALLEISTYNNWKQG